MKSPTLRNPSGQRYLKGLFYETTEDRAYSSYTLKDKDWEEHPSLYRLWMELGDPLEFTFANTYLDGHEHWEMLCDCTWFKPYVARWRRELELKIRSAALLRTELDAQSGSRSSAASNRILLDGGWNLDKKRGRGRPSKHEIKQEAKRLALSESETDTDMLRIGLTQEAPNVGKLN